MIITNDKYLMSESSGTYYSVQMKLVIKKFHKTDLGGYKCISKNSIGDAEGNIRLYEMELPYRAKSALDRLDLETDSSSDQNSNEEDEGQSENRLYSGYQGPLREQGPMEVQKAHLMIPHPFQSERYTNF
ncbi:uncharacterized protein LOC113367601 [Ctenocephalides felis]|uniref:uncharacterized protein LOC113367601 n=1 Tax=Ctenocephalides felis TaxID=7515 RepID=UPI000E6E3CF1|nr:uncharacterized protein LOC113367601 [Ctenocephalides felis]